MIAGVRGNMGVGRMNRGHVTLGVAVVLSAWISCCATSGPNSVPAEKSSQATAQHGARNPFDDAQSTLLKKGVDLVERKQPEQAIRTSFDPVIAAYAARYSRAGEDIYSAATMPETLIYLSLAATDKDKRRAARKAIVVGPGWGHAWFWKGYALGELGDNVAAQAALQQALRLSPYNPHFLSELGYTYIREQRWIEALSSYESADAFVVFAPEENQKDERGRALRGQGYALVELGRYDEAEAKYRACLALDPKDEKARGELGYVLEQKAKAKAGKL